MGVCTGLDIEGTDDFDYSIARTDGKGITDIVLDIKSSEDSLINELARKYNIDVTPFKLVPSNEDDVMGPYQDPKVLLNSAEQLNLAFEKEETNIIGKRIADRKVDIRRLQYYKLSIYDIIKFSQVAVQKNKQIRFMIY
jgi:hypothetical protein